MPKPMDSFTACCIAEGLIEPEDESQVVEAWQYLHNTGLAYQLQGWVGLGARDLIEQGVIHA